MTDKNTKLYTHLRALHKAGINVSLDYNCKLVISIGTTKQCKIYLMNFEEIIKYEFLSYLEESKRALDKGDKYDIFDLDK